MVYGDRLMRLLAEEALARLPSIVEGTVETPCGTATGPIDSPTSATEDKLCLVSVVRSGKITRGDSLPTTLRMGKYFFF